MPSLAITGSLGSGKSSLVKKIISLLQMRGREVVFYSADEANRRLLEKDQRVITLIRDALGKECLHHDGTLDRQKIWEKITSDSAARRLLEKILHPRLEAEWKPLAESYCGKSDSFLVAEIPLLFDKRLESHFDTTITVACSDAIRSERLRSSRNMALETVVRRLSLQESQDRKIAKADHVVWNDGSLGALERQAGRLLPQILSS